MSRSLLRLLTVCAVLAVGTASAPALAAAGAPDDSPGHRAREATGTSRVVERVEVGLLGSATPHVVKERVLRGRQAQRSSSFDVAAVTGSTASIQSSSESCFWAKPTWTRYNGFGKLASRAWYYIEWCGRNGVVSRVLTLYCNGVAGGGFSYAGCRVRRGATGYSRVNVSGSWRFPFKVGIYTFITRTMTVSARHYATGRYSGTWRMYQ